MDGGDEYDDNAFYGFCGELLKRLHASKCPEALRLPTSLIESGERVSDTAKFDMMEFMGVDLLTLLSHRWEVRAKVGLNWDDETTRVSALWGRMKLGENWRELVDEEQANVNPPPNKGAALPAALLETRDGVQDLQRAPVPQNPVQEEIPASTTTAAGTLMESDAAAAEIEMLQLELCILQEKVLEMSKKERKASKIEIARRQNELGSLIGSYKKREADEKGAREERERSDRAVALSIQAASLLAASPEAASCLPPPRSVSVATVPARWQGSPNAEVAEVGGAMEEGDPIISAAPVSGDDGEALAITPAGPLASPAVPQPGIDLHRGGSERYTESSLVEWMSAIVGKAQGSSAAMRLYKEGFSHPNALRGVAVEDLRMAGLTSGDARALLHRIQFESMLPELPQETAGGGEVQGGGSCAGGARERPWYARALYASAPPPLSRATAAIAIEMVRQVEGGEGSVSVDVGVDVSEVSVGMGEPSLRGSGEGTGEGAVRIAEPLPEDEEVANAMQDGGGAERGRHHPFAPEDYRSTPPPTEEFYDLLHGRPVSPRALAGTRPTWIGPVDWEQTRIDALREREPSEDALGGEGRREDTYPCWLYSLAWFVTAAPSLAILVGALVPLYCA